MPKLPKIYRNLSIDDFDEKSKKLEPDEKFEFICDYILSYGLEGEEDFGLDELIYHARDSFIDSLIQAKEEYEELNNKKVADDVIDPYNKKTNQKLLAEQKLFIKNPLELIQKKIRIEPKKYNNDNDNQVLLDWDANLAKLSIYIIKYGYNYKLFAPKGRVKSFRDRLTDKLFPSNKISNEAIFEYTKGGFFENFFKTTSQEYKNFKSAFLDFQDPENKNFGNLDNLEKTAKAYLHHKIPAFKTTDHLPKLADIENLSGTSKKRALLCFGVLETIYRQREIDKIENTFKDAEIDIQQDVIVDEQDKFQKDLDLKIDDSKINDNIINNEIPNDLENDKTM